LKSEIEVFLKEKKGKNKKDRNSIDFIVVWKDEIE